MIEVFVTSYSRDRASLDGGATLEYADEGAALRLTQRQYRWTSTLRSGASQIEGVLALERLKTVARSAGGANWKFNIRCLCIDNCNVSNGAGTRASARRGHGETWTGERGLKEVGAFCGERNALMDWPMSTICSSVH